MGIQKFGKQDYQRIKATELAKNAYRFYASSPFEVYNNGACTSLLKKEAGNQIFAYTKEGIRKGAKVFVTLEDNGNKLYTLQNPGQIANCRLYSADVLPLNFLLMSHEDYLQY